MANDYYTGDLTPNQPAIVDSGESGTIKLYSTTGTNIDGTITQNGITLNVSNLQQQIDTMKASSDVTDIVGNYQELLDYDTSKLGDNDIIKVLDDETHDNARSYYRWIKDSHSGSWSYIGSESNIEVDDALSTESENPVQNKVVTTAINGKQDTLTAGSNITISSNIISATAPVALPRFSVNNGNKNAQGTMDVLSYSGQTLSFKVDDGTTYEPIACTDGYDGGQFEKTSLNTVSTSSLNEATYNVFVPKTGNQPYLLNNTIFVQAEKPADTPTDTIPNMTSNTAPYGTITWSYNGAPSSSYSTINNTASNLYKAFKQGVVGNASVPDISDGTYYRSVYFPFTYTYAESYRPQAGLYQFKYTAPSSGATTIGTVKITYEDETSTTITRNASTSFTQSLAVTSPVVKIEITAKRDRNGGSGIIGAIQLVKPAILDEGTIWVNNGVEPLEVQARDSQGQWQPFYDVLAGTVTVNSSHNITAVTNQGFNYFSTVNMHNVSTTAHEDIRTQVETNKTDIVSLKRTGTTSYAGLVKLYDSTGNNTDGTINQSVITSALGNKQDTSNLVTSVSSLSTDTQYPSAKCVYTLHANEIASGTVIEGKFSDLPTFFAGLEGKYCNGTVTYKITEDETISTQIVINVPNNDISQIIIDGNEKSAIDNCNVHIESFIKIVGLYNGKILMKNCNFVTDKASQSGSMRRNGIEVQYLNDFVVTQCTFSEFANIALNFISCKAFLLANQFDTTFSSFTDLVVAGVSSDYGSIVQCENNIFSKISLCLRAIRGSILTGGSNSFVDCAIGGVVNGGGLIAYNAKTGSSITTKYSATSQTFNTGVAYNS